MTALRVTFAALVAFASLTASAWWESVVVTNSPAMTSQSYVTNGLVAMWDGIENAGVGMHDSTLRVWKDISGNGHDGTFTQGNVSSEYNPDGAWGDNCYIFPNSCACAEMAITFGPSCTVESCFSNRQKVSTYWGNYDTKDDKCAFYYNSSEVLVSFYLGSGNRLFSSHDESKNASCGTYAQYESAGAARMYFNAEQIGNTVTYSAQSSQTKQFAIGGPYASNFFTGNMHSTRIYNRALTAAEIAHNYAVDKQRFIDGHGNNPAVSTNRVYHANPPQTAYDAANPWNAPERTRIGGDDTTLRPSAIIKEN